MVSPPTIQQLFKQMNSPFAMVQLWYGLYIKIYSTSKEVHNVLLSLITIKVQCVLL